MKSKIEELFEHTSLLCFVAYRIGLVQALVKWPCSLGAALDVKAAGVC